MNWLQQAANYAIRSKQAGRFFFVGKVPQVHVNGEQNAGALMYHLLVDVELNNDWEKTLPGGVSSQFSLKRTNSSASFFFA